MEIGLLAISALTLGLLLFLIYRKQGNNAISGELRDLIKGEFYQNRDELTKNLRETRLEITKSMERLNEVLGIKAKEDREELSTRLKDFQDSFSKNVTAFNELQKQNFERLNQKQDELVKSTELKLEKMRETVDEKLHKTLEDRLGKSFELVTQQLLRVQKGLGEMQTLAAGVGDLKKVLSNVKTSGVLGEIQLGNILEQILAPEQYDTNVKTKKGSDALVEYAIKLPGKSHSSGPVYLPVDAKFPQEDYARLQSAYDGGDPLAIETSLRALLNAVKKFAKDIATRYIDPPHTTDFGIMFLPFEGLYAEVTRHPEVIAQLQREYKIILTGPTTLAAMLNSLQMGFKTLAIQKRSSEVWEVLASIKKEFSTFGTVLEKAQRKIKEADNEIEKMVTTRTRIMLSKLRKVEQIEPTEENEAKEEDDLFKLP